MLQNRPYLVMRRFGYLPHLSAAFTVVKVEIFDFSIICGDRNFFVEIPFNFFTYGH